MNSESIRAFIAVKIAPDTVKALAGLISRLKESPAQVKWVRPESIHFTLKFLGNIEAGRIDQIEAALAGPLSEESPFRIDVGMLGGFPNLERPRVLWAGVEDAGNGLKRLAKLVDRKLTKVGFAREKRAFAPHLTLGRVKNFRYIEDVQARMETEAEFDGGGFTVDNVHLYKSLLKPTGAVYTILKTFPLIGDNSSIDRKSIRS
jgi:2'-5' RNA ligase